ncbi:MAG TPA: C10 family peptidase [bacterium]
MKMLSATITVISFFITVIVEIVFFNNLIGFSAPVTPTEATAIADVWYAMELNSGHLKMEESERSSRLSGIKDQQVMYLVSADELLDEYPHDRSVLAYIVIFKPNGFVVVSGDDRIEPLMVCSADSRFRWDQPKINFLRFYLGKTMPAFWKNMPAQTNKNWSLLRGKLAENLEQMTFDDNGRAYYILWYTAPWDQTNYYNDTCAAHNGGNEVPTGCVATALAIKMHCHSWPPTGNGSHSYTDNDGSIQYSHNVNLGAQSYNWAAMPYDTLVAPNSGVARVMYHSGVTVNMDYELIESGANTGNVAEAMNSHFRYRGATSVYDSANPSGHEAGLKTSVVGRLPTQIGGWGHSVLVDGWTDQFTAQWHINCGWSGANNGWYLLDMLPPGGTGVISRSIPYAQPNNWIYIDSSWVGTEDGRINAPYNTLTEGEAASINGGQLMIRTGTYAGAGNVPVTFDNAVEIRAFGGDIMMGDNLTLTNYDGILLHGNGQLKITPAK